MDRSELEKRVANRFNRSECVLVGRATTGLKLVLDVLSVDGEVIYPTYLCPSPVYAAEYTGANPVFCDVNSEDYTANADDIAEHISDNTEAVVAVHTFGHPANIDEIRDLCSKHDAVLIEDACQAVGTERNGWTSGSVGDVSLLSFGSKKPIDAGGGGAVLTDDTELAEQIRAAESEIPARDQERLDCLYDHYREIFYAIESLEQDHPPTSKLFENFPSVFRELYLQGFDDALLPSIANALDELSESLSIRREHAAIYRRLLNHPKIRHPDPSGSPIYYRYSIALESPELRSFVVSYLRDRDYHVSTLYDPIHKRFGSTATFPTAETLSERTINLWVAPTVGVDYVEKCTNVVLEAIETYDNE